MSENDKLKARISELAGRLNLEKQRQAAAVQGTRPSSSLPYSSAPYHPYQRPQPPFHARARGGGGPPFRNRSLIVHHTASSPSQEDVNPAAALDGEGITSPDVTGSLASSSTSDQTVWYSKTGRHRQLINASVIGKSTATTPSPSSSSNKVDIIAPTAPYSPVPRPQQPTNEPLVERGGIIFSPDTDGNRLVRLTLSQKPSPEKAMYKGIEYLRSDNGNMYPSHRLPENALKTGRLCPRFTTSGVCSRGSRCHDVHDASKVAICKDFLNSRDCRAGKMCDLSHEADPHRSPVCVHYLRGNCTNDNCRYSHVNLATDARVCRQFATLGYCEKGGECMERHVSECPDYTDTGACPSKRCRLAHIDRAGMIRKVAGSAGVRGDQPGYYYSNGNAIVGTAVKKAQDVTVATNDDGADTASTESDDSDNVAHLQDPNGGSVSQQSDFIPI